MGIFDKIKDTLAESGIAAEVTKKEAIKNKDYIIPLLHKIEKKIVGLKKGDSERTRWEEFAIRYKFGSVDKMIASIPDYIKALETKNFNKVSLVSLTAMGLNKDKLESFLIDRGVIGEKEEVAA